MTPMHNPPLEPQRPQRPGPSWPRALRTTLQTAMVALASALVLLFGGCGPGVGGTGTGATTGSLDYFGASSTPLCSSELAPLLACPGSAGGPVPLPGGDPGTAVRYFADSATAPRVHLRMEGQRAELDAPCARLQFSGEWGQVPGRAGRFYGGAVQVGTPLPASLTASRAGITLAVELLDAEDHSLLATLQLVPVPAPVVVSCQ